MASGCYNRMFVDGPQCNGRLMESSCQTDRRAFWVKRKWHAIELLMQWKKIPKAETAVKFNQSWVDHHKQTPKACNVNFHNAEVLHGTEVYYCFFYFKGVLLNWSLILLKKQGPSRFVSLWTGFEFLTF